MREVEEMTEKNSLRSQPNETIRERMEEFKPIITAAFERAGYVNMSEDAPTADVVEVVRCKDCKYGNFLIQNGQEIVSCTNEAPPFADYFCPPMRLDDFCSYGERRDQP